MNFFYLKMTNSSRPVIYVINPGEEIYLTYTTFPRVVPMFRFTDKAGFIGVQLKYTYKYTQNSDSDTQTVKNTHHYNRASKSYQVRINFK